jgi:hypothetical protein
MTGAAWRRMTAVGLLALTSIAPAFAQNGPVEWRTNESEIGAILRPGGLAIDDPLAVFAFVLGRLPDRVQVYPSENYYYFSFIHGGLRYDGNIRLAAANRDHGELYFSYNEQITDWNDKPRGRHAVLGATQGVTVEKLAPLSYRVAFGDKSVTFALNDLSQVKPPPGLLTADETFIGTSFDESALRFFLVFNRRLKIFHFLLDETFAVADVLSPLAPGSPILVGKRTGFAFYQYDRRKILVGASARQSRLNSYLDGPFDQLPENFIDGETLREAIVASDPRVAGKVDRFGLYSDGLNRYLIHPYLLYERTSDLAVFQRCATSKSVPAAERPACFVIDNEESMRRNPQPRAVKRR